MFRHIFGSRLPAARPHIVPPPRRQRALAHRSLVCSFLLTLLLLLSQVLGNWGVLVKPVEAASDGTQSSTSGGLTFQQFLSEGQQDHAYHGPPIIPANSPSHLKHSKGPFTDYAHLPPSAEPAKMQPISMPLDKVFLTTGSTGKPLDLLGSDGRLEVVIQPGTFDLSKASVASGGAPQGGLTLHFSQISGHFVGWLNQLGSYQLQLLDSHGHVVNGILLRTPITFIYHYQTTELDALGMDPGHLVMTWPALIAAAKKAHASTANLSIPLKNDPTASTLTGQSTVIDPQIIDFGIGDPSNQSPPALHLASVQGNSGQFTYSYPLRVAPGPNGFAPQLALKYSSSGPNERHSLTSPASDEGDGWSLSLGSISLEVYPNGTTWYFLNDVAGVGDRLIPTPTSGFYATEHVSYLQIQFTNNCFHIWDKSGTYYELGCTGDSLQYWKDSTGTPHYYQWAVNKIVAPNEGKNAGAYRMLLVSYLQDSYIPTGSTYTTIRDAAMKQISYGLASSPNNMTLSFVDGTVDFHYLAPSANGTWADAYNYGTNYNCSSGTQPAGHQSNMRCDDPEQDAQSGSFTAPIVLSTLTLAYLTTYVGDDSAASHKAYRYDFAYNDTPYTTSNCSDSTGASGYCAGEHVLTSVTPSVYQYVNSQSQQNKLFSTTFSYTSLQDTYSDSTRTVAGQMYHVITTWNYLSAYADSETNEGVYINYSAAYNNAHGTPTDTNYQGGGTPDTRYDPFYCPNHLNSLSFLQCINQYAPYDDHAWGEQVVTLLQLRGFDSSDLVPALVGYQYVLAYTGQWDGHSSWCSPDQVTPNPDTDCVGDNWLPPSDTDWADYYHGEYQGFAQVLTTSPARDLTVDSYFSTDGWHTSKTNYNNFLGGTLSQEDSYKGNSASFPALLTETKDTYVTDSSACSNGTPGSSPVYYSCEAVLTGTTATDYELTSTTSLNPNAPSLTHSYTYDDYNGTWHTTNTYHNLTQDQISGSNLQPSNAPTMLYPVTKKWSYTTNTTPTSGWTYYTVDKATHSEIDDATGHVWQCQDITYDEGVPSSPPTPAAGWPTTVQTYTSGCNTANVIKTYNDYDQYGNLLATVDGVGVADPPLYTSNGCTPSGTSGANATGWSQSHYTACSSYDSYFAQPTNQINALNKTTSFVYDYTQGALPLKSTDPNGMVKSFAYSYDTSGNRTVQVTESPDTTNYTTQSITKSGCTSSSTLPCFEVDSISQQYNTVTSRTFYDSMGRAVETRTPGPGSYDTLVITLYNDGNHTVWKSNPFQVTQGSNWVDPNGVTDRLGKPVYGTVTFYDALGRVVAVQDQSWNTGTDGINCSTYLGTGTTYTACINYGLGQASRISGVGDTNYYLTATTVDPNAHVAVSYLDALGRTAYLVNKSGSYGGTLTGNELKTFVYNVLDKPTSVVDKDMSTSAKVTTTASYDDLGQLTQLADPDRGMHNYTYDPDGRALSDVSGTRTIGYVYDLLGRLGCVQDALPAYSPTGICTGGNPYVQNTYDSSKLTVSGTTDYPVGHLTQSVATTYYPDGSSASVTEAFEHDIRGRLLAEQLQLGTLPASWNVTHALPTYQAQYTYNDADQQTKTVTSTNPAGQGYTTYTIYDSTNGWLNGIGKTSASVVDLASFSYDVHAQVSDINFKTSTNSALLDDSFTYDRNLRPTSVTATWRTGSGSSGTVFSQNLTYDAASNLITLATTQAAVPGVNNSGGSETQVFCYDEQNRLLWAGNSGTPTCTGNGTPSNTPNIPAYSNSFAYTHLSQLAQGPLAGGSTQYQYLYCSSSQPHQLTGLYPSGTTCSNLSGAVYTSSYDSWGNITSRTYSSTTATLSYDLLDHLTKWNVSSTNKELYVYDASGNRVLRRTTNSSGTTMIVYAFGLEEHTYGGAGAHQSDTYYYTLGGRLIGSFDGTNVTFYLTDALGSVLSSVSNVANSAAVQGNQVFGPYGTGRYAKGTINTAKGFTGQYNDGTGLDYYNARYYDPVVGVFLSADSKQGNMQGMNPYAYVNGNPETKSDPSGKVAVGPGGQRYYPPVVPPPANNPPATNAGGGQAPAGSPAPLREMVRLALSPAASSRERDMAYYLSRIIAAYRQYRGDWDFADYAAGMWYLTDQNGNGNCFLCVDTIFSFHEIGFLAKSTGRDEINDPTHTGDAEQQLLTDWLTGGGAAFAVLASKIARMVNVHAILHIVLFTELPPCDQCKGYFNTTFLPAMAAIATSIMNGPPQLDPWPSGEVGIQFDVYAKDPAVTGGDWRRPISSPSDLISEPSLYIPFTPPYTAPDQTA